jgi:hypothetical protein
VRSPLAKRVLKCEVVCHGIEAIGNAAQQEDAPDAGPTAEELKDMF